MIFLILLICFGSAFSGYAERYNPESFVGIRANRSLSQTSDKYDLNHKPVALLSRSISQRTASTSHRHLNYSRFVDLLSTALSSKQPSVLQDFYQPDLYFKPIGLKLVFPEHYFW